MGEPKFNDTPQAKDDEFAFTEDNLTIVYLSVTANDDLGGNAKGLWSVDNGVNRRRPADGGCGTYGGDKRGHELQWCKDLDH